MRIFSAILPLPIVAVAQRALNVSLAAMRRLKSTWGRLTKPRKTIVVGIAVVAVMLCSSILNRGKPGPDSADNNVLTMVWILLVLLMWGLYRFLHRLRAVQVALALALSVCLHGFFISLASPPMMGHSTPSPRWVEYLIGSFMFLAYLFGYIADHAHLGFWFGLWLSLLGLLFSLAFYAIVAWKILGSVNKWSWRILGSLEKWSKCGSRDPMIGGRTRNERSTSTPCHSHSYREHTH